MPQSPQTPKTPKSRQTSRAPKSPKKTTSATARSKFKLDKDHANFLKSRLPEYLAFRAKLKNQAVGERLVKNTKGQQQEWVISNIVPPFLAKFNLAGGDGPILQSVKQVIPRSFLFFGKKKTYTLGCCSESLQMVLE